MIPEDDVKWMTLTSPNGARVPLFDSFFEVDERGQNGREKRKGG